MSRLIILQLIPVVISLLVLAAHFLRAGNIIMVVLVLVLVGVLGVRRRWAARAVEVALVLGAAEWVVTLVGLASARSQAGEPAMRMSMILGSVAVLTAVSALMFRTARLRRWYQSESEVESTGA